MKFCDTYLIIWIFFSVNSFLWQEWGPFDYRGGKHYADPQWARCTTQLHYKDSQRTTQSSWSGDRYTFDSRLPRNCKKEGFRYVWIYTYHLGIQLMQEVWNQTQYKLWYTFIKWYTFCILFHFMFCLLENQIFIFLCECTYFLSTCEMWINLVNTACLIIIEMRNQTENISFKKFLFLCVSHSLFAKAVI